jgi:FlaA1/EpsC-like NDP-sugar epimerase
MWTFVGLTLPRLGVRLARIDRSRKQRRRGGKRVLVLGAGTAGRMTARAMLENAHLGLEPICYLDEYCAKQGRVAGGMACWGPSRSSRITS